MQSFRIIVVFLYVWKIPKKGRIFRVFKVQMFSLELRMKRGQATRQPREAAPKDKGASFPSHPYQCVSSGKCTRILLAAFQF